MTIVETVIYGPVKQVLHFSRIRLPLAKDI
jgi:hypothetical protein